MPAAMIPNRSRPPRPPPAEELETEVPVATAGGTKPTGGARVSPSGDDNSAPRNSVVVRARDATAARSLAAASLVAAAPILESGTSVAGGALVFGMTARENDGIGTTDVGGSGTLTGAVGTSGAATSNAVGIVTAGNVGVTVRACAGTDADALAARSVAVEGARSGCSASWRAC